MIAYRVSLDLVMLNEARTKRRRANGESDDTEGKERTTKRTAKAKDKSRRSGNKRPREAGDSTRNRRKSPKHRIEGANSQLGLSSCLSRLHHLLLPFTHL
ncbi:hypothetical protein C8J56DRAFT_1030181 [Mycena floridula]|nr:hypothetical protein C8J56DRAFT_1030181 [Mycena floridula]